MCDRCSDIQLYIVYILYSAGKHLRSVQTHYSLFLGAQCKEAPRGLHCKRVVGELRGAGAGAIPLAFVENIIKLETHN